MNSKIEVFSPQQRSVENRSAESAAYQQYEIAGAGNENAREAMVLFPAGRFFHFPVRVRIQIAPESLTENSRRCLPEPNLNGSKLRLRTEVGRMVSALIENANCIDVAKPLPEIFLFGDVVVDFRKMEIRRGGELIEATAQEFKTLRYFVTHPERAISRDELLNHVWGYHHYPTTRTVDNRIMQLRKKLENDPAKPAHFLTLHGVGYKFVP